MTNLLQEAFAVVSQLPEAEQNAMVYAPLEAIAQLIWQQLAQREQQRHQTPIDFMQFAGIASAEESLLLQRLEDEIDELQSLD
ncbi:hypothetical protein Cylst_0924 [Cylindrospermum stagnale PCC 7417]|uniref:Uncharacterized protein n=1 Tax=Cylindrospermum stagnale PCC 7417 TaxID=56107 RepID=K9WTW6_9NOST|nr:hypothetical protein [Cylindrospermum stagnale]AFZ23249.1 hypothetical protein Cylst_0924 [Cylindrospermum stagnale PCC 7417]